MKSKSNARQATENAYIECKDFVMNRQTCWSNSPEGKHTEECFIEELAEKKCLAARLCPAQFKTFYQYTECHLWAESFAHENDPSYTEARERINNDRALKNMCRGIVQDLSKEMSKYSKYREEILENEPFAKQEELLL